MKIGDKVLMAGGGTIPGVITADLGNGNFEATWTTVKTFVFKRDELHVIASDPAVAAPTETAECPRCHGNKTIRAKHGTSYETDTATERAACWHTEKCPECHGTGEQQEGKENERG